MCSDFLGLSSKMNMSSKNDIPKSKMPLTNAFCNFHLKMGDGGWCRPQDLLYRAEALSMK